MYKPKKKITYSFGARIAIVCFLFLIIPLLIHTGFLYRREIRMAEADVRSCLKAIGGEVARRVFEQIHCDWQLLREGVSNQAGSARLSEDGEFLVVNAAGTQNRFHPLTEILSLQNPPFPIDVGFIPPKDQWVEQFPISDTELILFLGTSPDRVYELQTGHILFRVATFLLLAVFVGGGLVFLFVRLLSKPLSSLCWTMEHVAEGDAHCRYTPQSWGFEINSIGLGLNEMLDELLIKEKQAQELQLGHEIQKSLLPTIFPTSQTISITAASLFAHEVGGDFYDVFALKSGKILIAVADVAGKGVSACLFSLGLRSSLRALATTIDSLSEIVEKANELFLRDVEKSSHFSTLWIGIVDQNRLQFVSLGHPPALLKRKGAIEQLTTPYPALGAMPYESIRVGSMNLEPGDEILIFSDGVTDAMDSEGAFYGIDRLKEAFLQCHQIDGAGEILKNIQLFSKKAFQHDDLTILYFRMKKIE